MPNLVIEKAIRKTLNKPTEKLTEKDYSRVKKLDLRQKGLTNISMLFLLKNLQVLNLSGNKITDLAPLTILTELEILDLTNNEKLTQKAVDELKANLPDCLILFVK